MPQTNYNSTTFANFSMKYIVMCKVYTGVASIKYTITCIIIQFIITVKAYDGSVSPNKRLGAFCGARTRSVQTRSNVMYLRYFANAVGKATGFLTAYSQGKKTQHELVANMSYKYSQNSNQPHPHSLIRVLILSYDVASEIEITPCIKIDKPQVAYRFSGHVMK